MNYNILIRKIRFYKYSTHVLLGFILLLAAFLRFYAISSVPPSPDWDEAALGYNAYSILETGRDEYGKLFPIVLRSFEDYKPALYAYTIIPFIKFFGLNVISVRLPSAIFGLLAVAGTFFLVKELFKKNNFALLSAFLLALSPWHIQFSRVAFESNLALTLTIWMIVFFLSGLKKPLYLTVAASLGAMSIYSYQSSKIFIPLILAVLCCIFFRRLRKIPTKYIVYAAITVFILCLPIAIYLFKNKQALSRIQGTSIISNKEVVKKVNKRENYNRIAEDPLGNILGSTVILNAKEILGGYVAHYDSTWLFIKGDENPRHHAPFMGLLYLWEAPFFLIGFYYLFFTKRWKIAISSKMVVLSWFLIAPIPASLTIDVPHAVRTLNFLPTFQIIIGAGIIAFFEFVWSYYRYIIYRLFVGGVLFCIVVFNVVYFLNQYFVQQNYYNSEYWQYGYKDMISTVEKIQRNYKTVVISDKTPLDQSYIFYLFYTKYPPEKYQKNVLYGTEYSRKIGKYEFRDINWNKDRLNKNILYVGSRDQIPEDNNTLKTIFYLNGEVGMRISKT